MRKFLRIFGTVIKSIAISGHDLYFVTKEENKKCDFELMSLYCGRALVELQLDNFNLTYDVAVSVRSLLRHLQKLSLRDFQYCKLFARMLPAWAPELRELYFSCDRKREKRDLVKELRELQFFYESKREKKNWSKRCHSNLFCVGHFQS